MWPNLRNCLALQLLWLAAVDGAGRGWWWAWPSALALVAALHVGLRWHACADAQPRPAALALAAKLDSSVACGGQARDAARRLLTGFAPVWILALWRALRRTLNQFFCRLMRRPAWAVAVLGLGGPLPYLAAQTSFYAIQFRVPAWIGMTTLGALWCAAAGVLALLVARFPRLLMKATEQ